MHTCVCIRAYMYTHNQPFLNTLTVDYWHLSLYANWVYSKMKFSILSERKKKIILQRNRRTPQCFLPDKLFLFIQSVVRVQQAFVEHVSEVSNTSLNFFVHCKNTCKQFHYNIMHCHCTSFPKHNFELILQESPELKQESVTLGESGVV